MNIQVIQDDILENPKGQALLIFKFSDKKGDDNLFNKIDQKLGNELSKRIEKFGINFDKEEHVELHNLADKIGHEAVYVIGLGKSADLNANKLQEKLGGLLQSAASDQYKSCAILADQMFFEDANRTGKLISEALHLSQYRFLKYKADKEKQARRIIESLYVYMSKQEFSNSNLELEKGIAEGSLISRGVMMARDLVNEPAIYATPKLLADVAVDIAKKSNGKIETTVLDRKQCEKLGMGAFLAVAQGSDSEPQFIIMHYKGKNPKSNICLLGKAITFDSGGLSLKPSIAMDTMKLDMAGGATVLGVFDILASIDKLEQSIWGIIPACENMPDAKAIRPGDIITSLSGKTIEIGNTDGEGRLILADAIAYAQDNIKPDCIIDLATLTGAVMVALGKDIAGIIGKDEKLAASIKQSAEVAGELAWILPLHMPYKKHMKSDIADISNSAQIRYGGAIHGALFLEAFVKIAKWAHIDIAGVAFNEKNAHGIVPKGGTGWGVRTLIEYLQSI